MSAPRQLDLPADARAARFRTPGLVLAVVCVAQFMVVLDISIVNVALPDMQRELHMSQNALGWVLNAYTLTFAGFLLLGGRAADLWGRRRLFLIGVALFSLTSLLGGLAQTGGELIGARGLQGLGGAVLSPATLTILTTTFTDPKARTRALGLWSAVAGAGGATGVIAGGVLTDLLSWRWILFINVPIGLAVLAAARLTIVESRGEGERPTLDWGGALTITAGLVALVYGIVETDTHAWTSGFTLGFLAVGVVLLAAFLAIESRHPHPLVPLRLFGSRALTGANLIMVGIGSVMFTLLFLLSQYLQDVHGYSPLRTGFAFLPMPIALIIGTQLSSRLVARLGVRTLLTIGPLVSATGLLLLSRLDATSGYLHLGLPGALTTFGVGICFVPITLAATNGVDRRDAGLASGVINTTRQIGGSLGLAALLTVATDRAHALASSGAAVAQTGGYTRAFVVSVFVLVAAAVVAALVLPRPPRAEAEPVLGTAPMAEPLAVTD
ncbi:MAG: MFS transporter [Jatrophihabitans sp.]|uniref:MFS transporter n=1 Tax=Jatrophihabitans sp. TaxID=1932789 RepID=UPI003F7EAFB3